MTNLFQHANKNAYYQFGVRTNAGYNFDFLSMDEVKNIPNEQFFSFKDEDGFDTSNLPDYFINPNGTIADMLRNYEILNDVSVWEYNSRSVWKNEENLWWGDYHPNLLGYKLIAEEIFQEIENKL